MDSPIVSSIQSLLTYLIAKPTKLRGNAEQIVQPDPRARAFS